MSVLIQGDQMRALLFGVRVQTTAKTVPQNATATIFTIATGRIIVTSLVGQVTTVIAGTTPAAKWVATPTTGTASDMCTAGTITGREVGGLIGLPGPFGSAMIVPGTAGAGSGGVVLQSTGVVVAIGTIGINVSAADATGAIQYTLTYIPLDNGATVTAA